MAELVSTCFTCGEMVDFVDTLVFPQANRVFHAVCYYKREMPSVTSVIHKSIPPEVK